MKSKINLFYPGGWVMYPPPKKKTRTQLTVCLLYISTQHPSSFLFGLFLFNDFRKFRNSFPKKCPCRVEIQRESSLFSLAHISVKNIQLIDLPPPIQATFTYILAREAKERKKEITLRNGGLGKKQGDYKPSAAIRIFSFFSNFM